MKHRFYHTSLRCVLAAALCIAVTPLAAFGRTAPDAETAETTTRVKAPAGSAVDANGYPCVAGEVLVKFEPTLGIASVTSAHKTVGVKQASAVSMKGLQRARLPKGLSITDAIARYEEIPGVAYAQPNYLYHVSSIPTDPRFDELWGMNNTGQTGGTEDADIDAPEAWDVTTGDSDIVVAVIDTGVDYNHPDLAGNIWTNPGEIAGNGIDDDGNGYVDDVHGYDFFNYDGDPIDDHSHGTHCSGTIGAVADNGIGVAGVAQDVSIMAVKFLSADGWGDTIGAVESIYYAEQMGADIMSNSWGGGPWEQVLNDAIASTDALFVAAAGNDSMDTDRYANYPSCYDLPNVLAVGATDHNDQMSFFSNWGAETVDVFAPGEDVLSTVAGPPPSFAPDIAGTTTIDTCDSTTGWDLSNYEKKAWALDTTLFTEGSGALSLTNYRNFEDSWAIYDSTIDLSTLAPGAVPALYFEGFYDTEEYWDYLHVWASGDGVDWKEIGSFTGSSGGFRTIMCDLSAFLGDADVHIAFSLTSDEIIDARNGYTGAAIDDVRLATIYPLMSDSFGDLSNWDATDFQENPWEIQSDWYTSAPSAAGNLDYVDNEFSMLKLASPLDLSGESGGLALSAQLFYEIDPFADSLQVLGSTNGNDWSPLATYRGWSGFWESGFKSVTIDVSGYAGESEVYLAFALQSDDMWSSEDGLTGVAVDDVHVLAGTWSEADYSNAYASYSGTSMATPHVSGIAALALSEWPGKSAEQIKGAIIKGADYLPQLDGMCVSNGRANALSSIGDLYGPDVTDDAVSEYTGKAEIELNATDDSGVASISYHFDGDEPTTVEGDTALAITSVPAKWHSLTYWAEDKLGNVSDPVTVEFVLRRGATSSVSVSGADRYATAIAASRQSFPDGADTVVIATGVNWPDALGGTALAGAVDGPILLTTPNALPDVVAAEVERLGATHAYVLGGTAAVGADVVTDLGELIGAGNVERISGSDRYVTARLIANEVIDLEGDGYNGTALVATGLNFPDALAAAPIARYKAWPILLANPAGSLSVPDEVSSAVILGGTGAVPDGIEAALIGLLGEDSVVRKGGSDRYGTAALVAAWSTNHGMHWEGVGITTGTKFADALAGGAMLGKMRSVLLLTAPNELPAATRAPLAVNKPYIQTVHFVGGTSAVSAAVRDQVMLAIE